MTAAAGFTTAPYGELPQRTRIPLRTIKERLFPPIGARQPSAIRPHREPPGTVTVPMTTAAVSPAEPSLVQYYAKHGYEPHFMAIQRAVMSPDFDEEDFDDYDEFDLDIEGADPTPFRASIDLEPLSPERYNKYREAFLSGRPHIEPSNEMLSLIEAETGLEGYQIGDTATLSGQLMVIEDLDSTPLLVLDITTTNPATVVGSWQYTCLTEYAMGNGLDYLNMVTQSIPEENGNNIYFTFNSDGTATRTVGNSSTLSVSGNWSLENGHFCCDLPDMSGDCWDIVWLTSSTMIITRTDNTNGEAIYQMMLEQAQY